MINDSGISAGTDASTEVSSFQRIAHDALNQLFGRFVADTQQPTMSYTFVTPPGRLRF
ncbi:hypothetical protein LN650_12435 [Klebsiella pneumoniae subsp. pneumoniae]|nr:hypothetical protein [Klebsiella pneumoniae subsp. pneumoniae]